MDLDRFGGAAEHPKTGKSHGTEYVRGNEITVELYLFEFDLSLECGNFEIVSGHVENVFAQDFLHG
jgi:hypothetical protein